MTKLIKISRAQRGKKKTVTIIVGLKTYGIFTHCSHIRACTFLCVTAIDLKKASKAFAQHFSCGSSVTGEDEIVVQGDICYDLNDFIQQKWPEV